MPNELEEIKKIYASNKKKIDYIKGLSQSSLDKLDKGTREAIRKQIKEFDDAEKDLVRRGIIQVTEEKTTSNSGSFPSKKEKPLYITPLSFEEAVEEGLDSITSEKDFSGLRGAERSGKDLSGFRDEATPLDDISFKGKDNTGRTRLNIIGQEILSEGDPTMGTEGRLILNEDGSAIDSYTSNISDPVRLKKIRMSFRDKKRKDKK
tara:strand:+ start:1106 stop:1723 length:618 start_codon:yes stop_codon:yes gene_type:complete